MFTFLKFTLEFFYVLRQLVRVLILLFNLLFRPVVPETHVTGP